MNKVKDCHEEDAILFFYNNCTDKGILNAINRREITRFADLASIVRKYCAMEGAWKTETNFWDNPALNTNPVTGLTTKSKNPLRGKEPYWRDGSMDPAKFIVQRIQY